MQHWLSLRRRKSASKDWHLKMQLGKKVYLFIYFLKTPFHCDLLRRVGPGNPARPHRHARTRVDSQRGRRGENSKERKNKRSHLSVAGSALRAQTNWPNLESGGKQPHGRLPPARLQRLVADSRRAAAAACGRETAGSGRSCLIVNQALLFPPIVPPLVWAPALPRPPRKRCIAKQKRRKGDF